MADGEVTSDPREAIGSPVTAPWRAVTLTVLVVVVAALAVSTAAPMATLVVGVILFGVLHVLLEARYLMGRFSALLTRPFLDLLAVLVGVVVVCRLLAAVAPAPARLAEIVTGFAVLGAAAWHGLDGRRRVGAWVVIGLAAVVSLAFPAHYVLVLAHLHNVVPLFFLWDWSRRIASRRGRRLFRGLQLLWALVVPVAVLLGSLDAWLTADPGAVRSVVGNGQSLLAAHAPPGDGLTLLAVRLLTVFAFTQTMHYVIWVALLPRVAPDVTAAFEARVPWATGPRVWAAGFVTAALFAVLFGVDFTRGTTLYAALASVVTYLELPLLLLLLTGAADSPGRSGRRSGRQSGRQGGRRGARLVGLPRLRPATPEGPAEPPSSGPDSAERHSA